VANVPRNSRRQRALLTKKIQDITEELYRVSWKY
jgi:hypothetical protein